MAELSLRPADPGDAARMAEIARAAYGHYLERMSGPPRPMVDDYDAVVARGGAFVAELDGEVAGMIVLATDEEGFSIDNLAVDPAQQGTGIGRALLEFAEAEARRAGHDSTALFTHETMTENLELYAKIGYVEYKRRDLGAEHGSLIYMRKRL